jgi:hypothetical protein
MGEPWLRLVSVSASPGPRSLDRQVVFPGHFVIAGTMAGSMARAAAFDDGWMIAAGEVMAW